MVSLSKLLEQGLKDARCKDVFHPGQTCLQFQFGHSGVLLRKCIKYFFPIAAVPLIIKGRSLQRKHVRDALKYYVELTLAGFLISQSVPISLCLVRAFNGKFTECNFLFIPMTLPTWVILFVSDRVARLFAASMFQVSFEAAIRNSKTKISRTLCTSKILQGILFMSCSAFVLHTCRTYGSKAMWVVKHIPDTIQNDKTNSNKCSHDGPCSRFCLNDFAKNVSIGAAVDLFKTFFGGVPRNKSFPRVLASKLLRLNFPTTFFLASYSCLYRVTSCLLHRIEGLNSQQRHITAAFLGGASYFFMPKLTLVCYAISVCIEISWKLFERQKFKNDLKHLEILKKIPFNRIYTCLTVAYIVKIFVFRPEVLSPLGVAIVKAFTGDRAPQMKVDIFKYLRSIQ